MLAFARFRPKLLDSLAAGYGREQLGKDVAAGVTVAFVALPLAMAFGIASGVTPAQGIATSVVAGFLISLLGGSRVQIGGPAGAFVALLYGIVERYGVPGLLLSTMMAGVLLAAMGVLRLGNLIRFIPVSIVVGFTNGIAVVIAAQQLKDFFGLDIAHMPSNFISQMATLAQHAHSVDPRAVAIGAASLALVVVWPKSYLPEHARWRQAMARVPGTVVVLVLATAAVSLLGLSVQTIGTRFGQIPRGLPPLHLPAFDWDTVQNLAMPAVSIALLGAIESLLCARVADGMIGDRHDPNQELIAQGVANFVVPFFGGVAATGTIARTVTNVRTGARSPVAGMVHAATVLAIVMVFAPLASNVPLAALAAILLFVAWNMGEWRAFGRLRHATRSYRLTMLVTFALTVVFDLTVAVEVGLLIASLAFIFRLSALSNVEPIQLPADIAQPAPGVRVQAYRVFGSLFFGSVTKLETLLDPTARLPDVVVLEMHQMINLDETGLDALETLAAMLARQGGRLVVAEPTSQPLAKMTRTGFIGRIGHDAVHDDLQDALAAARAFALRRAGAAAPADDIDTVAPAG